MNSNSNDQKLTGDLRRALEDDKNLRSYALKGDVVAGQARLQGIVDTLSEKNHATRVAADIRGIKEVDNSITVSTDGEITDDDVEMEVAQELEADPAVNTGHINAKSSEGVVTLMGQTEDPGEIAAALQAASKARGVKKVVSQVKKGKKEMTMEEIFHSQVNNDEE